MTPLRERCQGRWRSILPMLGMPARFLTNKNGPCPLCNAGRDRWRFDDQKGYGTWFCRCCGAGEGIKLAMLFTGTTDYVTIAQKIEGVLGEAPREHKKAELSDAAKREALNRLWQSAKRVSAGDPVDLWLRRRGVDMAAYPLSLRTCIRARYNGPPVSFHAAMLAKVTDAAGKPATIHRTFLTADGAKAPVDKVRMFCAGKVPPGGAVRLAPAAATMGVAEGIETALGAAKLFNMPVWAALSDNGMAKFEPPPGVEHLVIFGDNDGNGAGQRAAYASGARLAVGIKVDVKIPDAADTDWNDVLRLQVAGAA
jgi:putative DNA primase/helicase